MIKTATKLLLLSLTLVLLPFGCGAVDPTMQQEPIPAEAGNPPQETPSDSTTSKRHIVSGDGLANLKIGDDKRVALDLFGESSESSSGYLSFPTHGISVKHDENGKITHLFYYFCTPKYSVFDGATAAGICEGSVIADVVNEYGKPTKRGESVVSKFGAKPGANEVSLLYEDKGLVFTFWDDTLADVRSLGVQK